MYTNNLTMSVLSLFIYKLIYTINKRNILFHGQMSTPLYMYKSSITNFGKKISDMYIFYQFFVT